MFVKNVTDAKIEFLIELMIDIKNSQMGFNGFSDRENDELAIYQGQAVEILQKQISFWIEQLRKESE